MTATGNDMEVNVKIQPTSLVLLEIENARRNQDKKWGVQNHPFRTAQRQRMFSLIIEASKTACDQKAKDGGLTWDWILWEEYVEALGEPDPVKARAELVQMAAVVVAMIESLDRNELKK